MKIKALFLLITFLLNTAVGMACALHMAHERHERLEHVHTHYHHGIIKRTVHDSSKQFSRNDGSCCQGAVSNFNALAKVVPEAVKLAMQMPMAIMQPWNFRVVHHGYTCEVKHRYLLTTRQRPPTVGLRILIQSFQI